MVNLPMICLDEENLFDRNQKYPYFPCEISG